MLYSFRAGHADYSLLSRKFNVKAISGKRVRAQESNINNDNEDLICFFGLLLLHVPCFAYCLNCAG